MRTLTLTLTLTLTSLIDFCSAIELTIARKKHITSTGNDFVRLRSTCSERKYTADVLKTFAFIFFSRTMLFKLGKIILKRITTRSLRYSLKRHTLRYYGADLRQIGAVHGVWLRRWTCDQQVAGSTPSGRDFGKLPYASRSHTRATVTKQYNLVPAMLHSH